MLGRSPGFPLCTLALLVVACSSSSSGSTDELPDLGEGRFGTVNEEQLRAMVEIDPTDDAPFYMVNFVKFREMADYADGRETDLTGREADALYRPLEFLDAIGAEIVFVAQVEETLLGDGTEWDQIAIVRYPSRAKFFEMTANEEFQARAIHKDAGVEKSLVIVSHRREGLALPSDGEVPNPATPEDPPVAVVHLIKFNDIADYGPNSSEPERTGREAMELYQNAATPIALAQGVDPIGWFDVEGVLIGDEREWDEFRINLFPSQTAWNIVLADPTRTEKQVHRFAAIEDTYTTVNGVIINELSDDGTEDGPLEVTENGTGTLCDDDTGCEGQGADFCLLREGLGFCTVQGCAPGACEGDYLCCHDCADFAAGLLPFEGSACLPSAQTAQAVTAAMCTCD